APRAINPKPRELIIFCRVERITAVGHSRIAPVQTKKLLAHMARLRLNGRMLMFDAHLDLAMNALEWNRDLTRPIEEIREREKGMTDKPDRGMGTVCLPEMRRGGIGLCVATLIARIEHNAYSPVFGWRSQEQAWAQTQGQLAWYRAMEDAGQMAQLKDAECLKRHLKLWAETLPGSFSSSF